jgi:hypothetical protein
MQTIPLTVSLCILALGRTLVAQCAAPVVADPAADVWSDNVVAALIGNEACYADKSAFTNADCNIFVGRVLEVAYGATDFVLSKPADGFRYKTSNEVAVELWTNLSAKWEALGALTDQSALDNARQRALTGKPVVAVFFNPVPKQPGHVALIGPGPLTPSKTLKVRTPVSASFFQGHPEKNYVAKPLACAFTAQQAPDVRLYAKK